MSKELFCYYCVTRLKETSRRWGEIKATIEGDQDSTGPVVPQMDNFVKRLFDYIKFYAFNNNYVGLGGLWEMCPFAGSNPAEVDGFFQDVKILSTNPPGGTLNWGSRV